VSLLRPYGDDGPTLSELARQALSSTERGYDLLAPRFYATPFRTPDDLLDQVEQVVRRRMPTPRRGLDLCCGTGAATAMLARLCTDEVVGLDRSAGMLGQARARLATIERPTVRFVRGDALDPRVAEGTFDLVTSFGAFGHIQEHEQPAFLRGVHRCLAPSGRFVFVTGFRVPRHRPAWWLLRGFNGVMRVRNLLVRPPFHMYYLNFRVPDILPRFEQARLELTLHPMQWRGRRFVVGEAVRA